MFNTTVFDGPGCKSCNKYFECSDADDCQRKSRWVQLPPDYKDNVISVYNPQFGCQELHMNPRSTTLLHKGAVIQECHHNVRPETLREVLKQCKATF